MKFQNKFLQEHSEFKDIIKEDKKFVDTFTNTAFEFLKASVIKMREILPYDDRELFDSTAIFLADFSLEKWHRLKVRFGNIIEDQNSIFEDELKRIKFNFFDLQLEMRNCPILEVWSRHKSKYPLIFNLARSLMVTPYSSCPLERVFSKCTDIKTLKRNRLRIQSLEACLLIKQQYLRRNFICEPSMMNSYQKHF